jgi:hypothetical protein
MLLLLFLISLPFYFLPAIIAGARGHKNGFAIFVLTFFTGWTLLGWVAAFIWACVGEIQKAPLPVEQIDNWDRTAIYGGAAPAPLSEKLSQPIFQD